MMARLALCLFVAVNLVFVVWGQTTHAPIIPDLPPPPTFPSVVNESVSVFVGEPVPVSPDVRVTIDCGPLIDASIVANPDITWFKNGNPITNGSAVNVVISQDERFCIVTDTLLAVGGQLGTDGNYSCEVCSDPTTCNTNISELVVCGEPHLSVPGPSIINPFIITISCGQNVTVASLDGVVRLTINCGVFNGSEPLIFKVYKDGVLVGNTVPHVIASPDDDDAGTYTVVVCTRLCGAAYATSRILLQGDPPDIDEGPFIPEPPSVMNGTMTVRIGTPIYVIDGFDVVINCNIVGGTPPITITWLRNGAPDPTRGNVSTITVTDASDGDVFTCRADNNIGFDMHTSTIREYEPPQILPIPFPTPPPDEVAVSTGIPSNTVVGTGTKVTVYCPSSGIGVPSIVWFKDGVMITASGRFMISTTTLAGAVTTSVLMIDDFQPEDAGVYSCRSTNVAGSALGEVPLMQQACPACPPPAVETISSDPDECSVCADWIPDPFGECSLDCHLGVQTRDVRCIDLNRNNQTVLDTFCDPATRPNEEQSCGFGPCATGWRKGPWSKCSRTCQTGYQRRLVECIQMGLVVPDSECGISLRPKSERFCNGHIHCFPCKDDYPKFCPRIMGTPDCMKEEYRKACCWSCGND